MAKQLAPAEAARWIDNCVADMKKQGLVEIEIASLLLNKASNLLVQEILARGKLGQKGG